MNVLKQFYIRNLCKQHIILVNLNVFSLLVGSVICLWVILKLVANMESMVLNLEYWNSITVHETLSSLHIQSLELADISLRLNLVLP